MNLKNVLILNNNFNEILFEAGGILYLFEQGFVPDAIISTSFSSITSAFLGKEPTIRGIRDILDFYKNLKKEDMLYKSFIEKILFKKFYSFHKIEKFLRKNLPESFGLLKIPTYIVCYDIKANEFRIFGQNPNDNIISAIKNTISFPPIYKNESYISANIFPLKLIEFALEIGANKIYYFLGNYDKLYEIISKDYKILLKENYKKFMQDIIDLSSRILLFEFKSSYKLFDFSKPNLLIEEGYKQTRKQYVSYKLFRFGRVKETLELLKRPDLDDDERIIKAHAIYLEGDIPQAYSQFSELYEKYPENEIVIVGYANSLIDIGDLQTAGQVLESYKNRTKNPYLFDSLSRYYFYKGEIDKSLENIKIAMNYAKNDPIAYNLALIHYAIIMASIGRFKDAYESFNSAIVNLKNFDNAYYLSFAYTNAMNFYMKQRDRKKLEFLISEIEESLNLSGSSRTKFLFYLNYAFSIPEFLSDSDISINYARKAIDIAIEKGSPQMLSLALNGLGDIYSILNEFEKAEIYLNEALKVALENDLKYNIILTIISLIQVKLKLNKIDEVIKLFELLPSEEQIPPPDLIILNSIKALIYQKIGDNEKLKKQLEITINLIKEFKMFDMAKISPIFQNEVSKIISSHLTIDEIIETKSTDLLMEKMRNEPKVIQEFLEKLRVEDSINYIEIIKTISKDDKKFKIQIDKFSEHWRKFCEQYITTFGDVVYFFNNDIKPITIFGDEINLLILLYLISNRNKVITYGNLSIAFGIHSENIKPRLDQILEVIEPWTITQTPKYLIVENDKILFKTDENFKVDLYLFEDYLKNGDLESAVNIYHGDFLPYISHPYFSELRNRLKKMYLDAVYNLAQGYISDGKYDRAIIILESLLNKDILNVEHLKLLISVLYKVGKRAYAYEWYLRYLTKVEEPRFKFEEIIS